MATAVIVLLEFRLPLGGAITLTLGQRMKTKQDIARLIGAPERGVYCDEAQYWYVRPIEEYVHDPSRDWTCIGGPGVDGIEFGVRFGSGPILAYYPIDDEFREVSDDVSTLIDLWRSGRLSV